MYSHRMGRPRLRAWLGIVIVIALVLAGCDEATEDTSCADAAALVTTAKSALETQLASTTEVSAALQIDDVASKFDQAATLCPSNSEASFYGALVWQHIFLDGATTTSLLTGMGYGNIRIESARTTPFAESKIVGGDASIDTYVNLSAANALQYSFTDFPAAVHGAVTRLAGVSSTFSTTLTVQENGSPKVIELDYTDAKALQAFYSLLEVALRMPSIYSYGGADTFITANSTRDPTTGAFTEDIQRVELETYFKTGDPLKLNQSGVNAFADAFASVFSSLQASITSVLAETDSQTDDMLVLTNPNPEFDQEPAVEAFELSILAQDAGALSAAFASSTPGVVTIYRPLYALTGTGCDPLASDGITDTSGATFNAVVWRHQATLSLRAAAQMAGEVWDNSTRSSIVLADDVSIFQDSLLFPAATVQSEIISVLPNATVTINGVAPSTLTNVDLADPATIVDVADPGLDSAGSDQSLLYPSRPLAFCANPFSFNATTDPPGYYER